MAHVDRVSNVLKGIRNFIRPSEPDFKPVNLLVVVQDVLQLLPANERKDSVVIQAVGSCKQGAVRFMHGHHRGEYVAILNIRRVA